MGDVNIDFKNKITGLNKLTEMYGNFNLKNLTPGRELIRL